MNKLFKGDKRSETLRAMEARRQKILVPESCNRMPTSEHSPAHRPGSDDISTHIVAFI